jgi:hypothetical protein
VKAVGHVAVVVGAEHQMLAAVALVRTGNSHVDHPPLVVIIDETDVGAGGSSITIGPSDKSSAPAA